MAEKKSHNFNIELLQTGDQNEWNYFYNNLKRILKAKAFEKNIEFEPDVFNDTMIIMHEKIQSIKTERDLINLSFAVYRNQKLNTYNKAARFANRSYIQGDDGFEELTPDHIASPEIEQEVLIEEEQLEFDLELLKSKLLNMQEKMNINNTAKNIDLFSFLIEYTSNNKKSLDQLVEEFGLGSRTNLHNLNLAIQKKFKMDNPLRKATTPYDDLKPSGKSLRKKKFNNR